MNKDETRLQIVDTAMRLFAHNGFASTSMNDIVRETGLSKGGVYWHFTGKEAIVEAIFDQYFEAQIALLIAFKQEDGAISSRIRRLVQLVGDELGETSQAFPEPLEFYAHALRQENLLGRLRRYFTTYAAHLADLIQQGMDSGEFRTGNALETAHILLSALEGLILLHSLTASQTALQSQLVAAAELILNGLTHPADDTTPSTEG